MNIDVNFQTVTTLIEEEICDAALATSSKHKQAQDREEEEHDSDTDDEVLSTNAIHNISTDNA